MTRRKLVAGNWKMMGGLAALAELDAIEAAARAHRELDVLVCPAFPLIAPAKMRAPDLMIGAQDCHENSHGAHTGCVSAAMLREAGASAVIVGHSERRTAQRESDAAIRAKAKSAIAEGMIAIVCVGESEAERQSGEAESIVAGQVFGSVTKHATPETVIVSYEPVWAIGTGRTPSAEEVRRMHSFVRQILCTKLGEARGRDIRILYGGSVNAGNAPELLAVPDVDGALVGGASLKAADFVPIIETAAALAAAAVAPFVTAV